MNRLISAAIVLLVLVSLAVAGCSGAEPATPADGETVVSSCETCHTDKDKLKEVASPEPEEATSEETVGEG